MIMMMIKTKIIIIDNHLLVNKTNNDNNDNVDGKDL